MRDIKFRAWCDPCHSFVPTMQLFHGDEGLMMYCPMHEGGVIKTKLTQFTGLLDKNGVDIYEGDLVRYCCKSGQLSWDQINPIIWEHGAYKHGNSGLGFNMPGVLHTHEHQPFLEVIGNIYENAELLE